MSNSERKAWRCIVCGYIHYGDSPPDVCPICGAAADDFEPYFPPSTSSAPLASAQTFSAGRAHNIVIAGGGIAALSAAEAIRKQTTDAQITLITQEKELPYYRLNLTRFLAGELGEKELTIHPASWYEEQQINLLRDSELLELGLKEHIVSLKSGETRPFDKLILALGAEPIVAAVVRGESGRVKTLRNLADARGLLNLAQAGTKCVCIGGGLLGLETAGALARRGVEVILLEGHRYLMPRQLNQRAAEILGAFVSSLGITLLTEARTKEIVAKTQSVSVFLEDGKSISADLVLLATGVRSSTALAVKAGLKIAKGVLVDNYLRTSHQDVFAAGDLAEHQGQLYGAWAAAQYQGTIAGLNAVGEQTEFGSLPRAHTLKILGLPLASIGQFEAQGPGWIVAEEEKDEVYQRLVFEDGLLRGAVFLKDTEALSVVSKAIEAKSDFSALLAKKPKVDELLGQIKETL